MAQETTEGLPDLLRFAAQGVVIAFVATVALILLGEFVFGPAVGLLKGVIAFIGV